MSKKTTKLQAALAVLLLVIVGLIVYLMLTGAKLFGSGAFLIKTDQFTVANEDSGRAEFNYIARPDTTPDFDFCMLRRGWLEYSEIYRSVGLYNANQADEKCRDAYPELFEIGMPDLKTCEKLATKDYRVDITPRLFKKFTSTERTQYKACRILYPYAFGYPDLRECVWLDTTFDAERNSEMSSEQRIRYEHCTTYPQVYRAEALDYNRCEADAARDASELSYFEQLQCEYAFRDLYEGSVSAGVNHSMCLKLGEWLDYGVLTQKLENSGIDFGVAIECSTLMLGSFRYGI